MVLLTSHDKRHATSVVLLVQDMVGCAEPPDNFVKLAWNTATVLTLNGQGLAYGRVSEDMDAITSRHRGDLRSFRWSCCLFVAFLHFWKPFKFCSLSESLGWNSLSFLQRTADVLGSHGGLSICIYSPVKWLPRFAASQDCGWVWSSCPLIAWSCMYTWQ